MPSTQPREHSILFGEEGLRPGWSLLLFLAFAFLGNRIGDQLLVLFHLLPAPSPELSPRTVLLGEAVGVAAMLLAARLLALLERRPFAAYGLPARRALPDFATGLLWGLLALSLLILTLFATHALAFNGLALHGPSAFAYAAKWAVAFFLVGVSEEFLFRGYLQFTLARGLTSMARLLAPASPHARSIGFWSAAFLLSIVLFTFAHTGNRGETPAGIFAVGLAGTVFAFSLWRTGSLWWAIGVHTAWDWAESYLYGTPDSGTLSQGHLLATHPMGRPLLSGGSAGPEGSLFVIPTFLLLALVIHLTLPRRAAQPEPEDQPPPR